MKKSISITIGVASIFVFASLAHGKGLKTENLGGMPVESNVNIDQMLRNRKVASDGGGANGGGLSAADRAMYQQMMKELQEYKKVMEQRNKDLEELMKQQ